MFELLKKRANKTFYNSSKNEKLNGEETLLLSQFRGDIWKMSNNYHLSEEQLTEELISKIGGFFDAERCVFSRIKGNNIYAQTEWKNNRVKGVSAGLSVPLDLIEKLKADQQRTVTLEEMMDAISGAKTDFLKPVIHAMVAAIGDAPSLSTPVKVNGSLMGFITMRFFNSKIEMYTKNVKDVITDAANIIALTIERRRSEEMFRASFDLNPDAMIFVNVSDGKIFDVNEGFIRASGFSREEATGKTTTELKLWYSEDERQEIVMLLKKDGIVKNKEIKFRRKDGCVITCLYSSRLINLNGAARVFTSIKDISDRKEMEMKLAASEEKFRVAFNTSPDSINLNRLSDGIFVEVNEGFSRVMGFSKDDVNGKTSAEIKIWVDAADRAKLISGLEKYGFFDNLEAKFRCKDGSVKTGLMSASIITIYGEPHILSVTKDITERKNMEQNLMNTTEKLINTIDTLEKTNEELERFAYVASHDMQEPLRMMSSYAQLMERKYKGRLDGDADDYLGYIISGAFRMSALIKDMLEFSRIGSKGRNLESVDINTLLKQVTDALQLQADGVNAVITAGQMPELKCDQMQIFQVFQNLLTNALKFVKKGQIPQINITAEHKGKEWIFCVKDNGIGISPQYFNKIFVVFERLHSKDEYEGTGIGLSICKKIVEHHGGRIWVESEPGKGASFFFVLPESD
ncbi:MAG: hypothetical protein CVV21_02665 [Candidatus Goldiibacteriota bacterium HGW-Goldbacteria-1]|jgi:PAS domain S-box-containing protein|nr:MAG: hypothetical protein CVV21_02665 [Candidatus Goldiibacteriota bacterium HGW-Goldbacteria-1]